MDEDDHDAIIKLSKSKVGVLNEPEREPMGVRSDDEVSPTFSKEILSRKQSEE